MKRRKRPILRELKSNDFFAFVSVWKLEASKGQVLHHLITACRWNFLIMIIIFQRCKLFLYSAYKFWVSKQNSLLILKCRNTTKTMSCSLLFFLINTASVESVVRYLQSWERLVRGLPWYPASYPGELWNSYGIIKGAEIDQQIRMKLLLISSRYATLP